MKIRSGYDLLMWPANPRYAGTLQISETVVRGRPVCRRGPYDHYASPQSRLFGASLRIGAVVCDRRQRRGVLQRREAGQGEQAEGARYDRTRGAEPAVRAGGKRGRRGGGGGLSADAGEVTPGSDVIKCTIDCEPKKKKTALSYVWRRAHGVCCAQLRARQTSGKYHI